MRFNMIWERKEVHMKLLQDLLDVSMDIMEDRRGYTGTLQTKK